MSEKLNPGAEKVNDSIDVSAESEANLKRLREIASKETVADSETVSSLEIAAKTEAISGQEISVSERESGNHSPIGVHRELKQVAYSRSMERIRSKLSRPERLLSKVIHNPGVDAVSTVVARTVARPSGILTGSLCALAGSLALLYLTKRYGFSYNYLIFLFLYIGGYLAGLLIELMVRLLRRR